jgi:hypothetical protein
MEEDDNDPCDVPGVSVVSIGWTFSKGASSSLSGPLLSALHPVPQSQVPATSIDRWMQTALPRHVD